MSQLFFTKSGQQIILGERLAGGGEGDVWTVEGQPEVVAKVYHPHRVTPDKEPKLRVMVSNPPKDKMRAAHNHISIAWPTDLLYEQHEKFAGFLMPYIPKNPTALEIYNPSIRSRQYPGFNWKYLHHTALNFAIALETLHACGYIMGDLNESNILISDNALVSLIDTDSFQVPDGNGRIFRCPVGKPEYTPPELQGQDFKTLDRKPEDDYFGLAVLIFHLLMEGTHPFAGVLTDTNLSVGRMDLYCIKTGAFPYDPENGTVRPRPGALGLDVLHPGLKRLFLRCFVDGHNNSQVRPRPKEWREALDQAEKTLVECQQDPGHYYANHLKQCPWCVREGVSTAKQSTQPQTPLQQPLPSSSSKPQTPHVPKPQPSGGRGGRTSNFGWPIVLMIFLVCGVCGVIGYSFLPGGEDTVDVTATSQARLTATAIVRVTSAAQAEQEDDAFSVSNSSQNKTATAQARTATAETRQNAAVQTNLANERKTATAVARTATAEARQNAAVQTNLANERKTVTAAARTATARTRATATRIQPTPTPTKGFNLPQLASGTCLPGKCHIQGFSGGLLISGYGKTFGLLNSGRWLVENISDQEAQTAEYFKCPTKSDLDPRVKWGFRIAYCRFHDHGAKLGDPYDEGGSIEGEVFKSTPLGIEVDPKGRYGLKSILIKEDNTWQFLN